jgi:K+-sensing histidine kinase KdpD
MLVLGRDKLSLGTALLLYLLAVVAVAVVGGTFPAVLAATASFLLANWFLTPPYHTFDVEQRDSVISLVVFVVAGLVVSVTVESAARQRVRAARTQVEVELLTRFAAQPVSDTSLVTVLKRVRDLFGMTSVALLERRDGGHEVVEVVGPSIVGPPVISVDVNPDLRLVAAGPELVFEDRQLLTRMAETAARAWEGQRLAERATRAQELAEIDSARSALLAAVSHDLRTPLAGIKAAVTSLRQRDVTWSSEDRAELLAGIDQSTDRLDDLISNLLGMSRLQAGALSVDIQPVALDAVVAQALLDAPDDGLVDVDVSDDLPAVLADSGLLERVVGNLIANARRFTPLGQRVHIHAEDTGHGYVQLRVIDHGPGVPDRDWEEMFAAFQRLNDQSSGSVGLGLAIARGFVEAMQGRLTPSHTPGGGLTMTISLPRAS